MIVCPELGKNVGVLLLPANAPLRELIKPNCLP